MHYRHYGGAVVSAAIASYVYIQSTGDSITLCGSSYSFTEEVDHVKQIRHKLVRTAMEKLGMETGLEITSIAEIPSRGTGLGSSSAFTAGLLHCLCVPIRASYRSRESSYAAEACEIEIDLCGEPIGKQDQYAYRSWQHQPPLVFNSDDTVTVETMVFRPGFAEKIR